MHRLCFASVEIYNTNIIKFQFYDIMPFPTSQHIFIPNKGQRKINIVKIGIRKFNNLKNISRIMVENRCNYCKYVHKYLIKNFFFKVYT